MKITKFIKTALADYKRVGALVPSSGYVARRITEKVCDKKSIVEYGAGEGVISREMLKRISQDAELFAFETNKKLFKDLENIKDDRFRVLNEDIRHVDRYLENEVDAVVSGVPFSFFEKKDREEIVKNTSSILSSEGVFILYQTTPLMRSVLNKYFKKVKIEYEPRNIPPYFIITAKKYD